MLVRLVCMLVITSTCVNAQTNVRDGTIVVRRSDLPAEVLQSLEGQRALAETAQKIETYGRWVGIGKELGTAVNESMSALTIQADKFAQTDVGKFTMFMVAYKVLGNDVIALFKRLIMIPIGIVIISIGTWVCIRSLKNMCWGRNVLEGIGVDKSKRYKFIEPTERCSDNRASISFFHGLAYLFFIGLMFWIFFS